MVLHRTLTLFFFPAFPDVLLVAIPLRVLRILVLLAGIAVLAAGSPIAIAARLGFVAIRRAVQRPAVT
jgi:hypothetical protein